MAAVANDRAATGQGLDRALCRAHAATPARNGG